MLRRVAPVRTDVSFQTSPKMAFFLIRQVSLTYPLGLANLLLQWTLKFTFDKIYDKNPVIEVSPF
jgi:hypothetical protein